MGQARQVTPEKPASALRPAHIPARSIAWDHAILSIIAVLAVLMASYPGRGGRLCAPSRRKRSASALTLAVARRGLLEVQPQPRGPGQYRHLHGRVERAGDDARGRPGWHHLSTRTDMPGGRSIGFLSLLPMLVLPFIPVVGWVAPGRCERRFHHHPRLVADRDVRTSWVNINTMTGLI